MHERQLKSDINKTLKILFFSYSFFVYHLQNLCQPKSVILHCQKNLHRFFNSVLFSIFLRLLCVFLQSIFSYLTFTTGISLPISISPCFYCAPLRIMAHSSRRLTFQPRDADVKADRERKPHDPHVTKPMPSPHLSLVLSSFTRPARPPPVLDPSRLTIYYAAGAPHVLGCGTFGVVYPAMLDSVCPVAVKHLRPRPLLSNSTPVSRESARDYVSRYARLAKRQFRREIRRYAALRTVPGVVRFYGLVGKDMFVVERLFGGALNNVIRDSTNNALLRPRCILRLAFMLAHAIADIHRRGISHGDLKPSNVLITEPLSRFGGVVTDAVHVKLVDFGLSRRFQPVDDDDVYDMDGDSMDEDDENFESNRQNDSIYPAQVTQSVQLVARRFSCPISDTLVSPGSDTELSDNDQQPTRSSRNSRQTKAQSHPLRRPPSSTVPNLSESTHPVLSSHNADDSNNEDDNDPQLPQQLAPAPFDARGTPAYLAPEGWCGPSALNRRGVALKADVYALGMILYELESGNVPWNSMSEWSIFVAVCNHSQRPPWSSDQERVPGLRAVIEDCWKQSYRNRPTCRQVARRLGELLDNIDAEAKTSEDRGSLDVKTDSGDFKSSNSPDLTVNASTVVRDGPQTLVSGNDAETGGISGQNEVNYEQELYYARTDKKSSNFIHHSRCVEYTTPPPSSPSGSFTSTPSFSSTVQSSRSTPQVSPPPRVPYHLPTSPTRTSIQSFPEPDTMLPFSNSVARDTSNRHQPRQPPPSFPFGLGESTDGFNAGYDNDIALAGSSTPSHALVSDEFEITPSRISGPKEQELSLRLQASENKTIENASSLKGASPRDSYNLRSNGETKHVSSTAQGLFETPGDQPGAASSMVPDPAAPKEDSYPYNEFVKADDCSALCNALAKHERNPKEVVFILEALGTVLSESQPNCICVATGGTLKRVASVLSKFGRDNSRLCKAVCFIVLGLAMSQSPVVEMKLRVNGACDMVLNCMKSHPADLPVIETGACALNSLCRSSPALCSVFVAQDGPSIALRAIERAASKFKLDVPVASLGLEVLSATALHKPHALLSNNLLPSIFFQSNRFGHCGIDSRLMDMLHILIVNLPESRDTIVCTRDSLNVIASIVDRTRCRSNWVEVLKQTCVIVSELAMSVKKDEAARAFLASPIVESIMESLRLLCTLDAKESDTSVATVGLVCLRNMCGLGEDVYGSLQMNNIFELLPEIVTWAPDDRSIALNVAVLTVLVLRQVKSSITSPSIDQVRDMLRDMQERWKHDTKILESINEAMMHVPDATVTPIGREDRKGRNRSVAESALSGHSGLSGSVRKFFSKRRT